MGQPQHINPLFPNDQGKTQKMNGLKIHWNVYPGTLDTHWSDRSNSAAWSAFPLCGQRRWFEHEAVFFPVRATENIAELTCEKCIAEVVGSQFWIGWALDRLAEQERRAGTENRTTRVQLWNARMYSLPYGARAVFSFLPIEHPARTQEQQPVGYTENWSYIKNQKQPQKKFIVSEREIAFAYYRVTWSDGSITDDDRLIVNAHSA